VVLIRLNNTYSHTWDLNDRTKKKLESKLSTFAPGYRYTWRYQNKKWDGKVCMISDGCFPTGLLSSVLDVLGSDVSIVDDREIETPELVSTTVPLRDYQWEAVKAAFERVHLKMWWPRGVFKVATGGGKTEIAAAMIEMARVPTLFIVHRKDLLHQAHNRFREKYGLNASMLGDGHHDYSGDVVVATVQTINAMYKSNPLDLTWMNNIEQVFFDEAHLIAADLNKGNLFQLVADLVPNAYMRWGLTATPFLKDQLSNWLLEGATGDVLYEVTNKELIERGFLTEPVVTVYKVPKHDGVPDNWPACYDVGIIANEKRNRKVVECVQGLGGPALVLVQRESHGKILELMFKERGMDVPFVYGKHDSDVRKESISLLKQGIIPAVIASTIWDEGVDIPELRTLVLAGGGKSLIKQLQRLGRGLRLSEGKNVVEVIDFYDKSRRWLKQHSDVRCKLWKEEGFKIQWIEM
jgi:superfamily II DNA or RNA helicase